MSNLGSLLNMLRTTSRRSLQDVADAASITKAHLWDMEKGNSKNPTVATLLNLGCALEVSPFRLFAAALEDQPSVRTFPAPPERSIDGTRNGTAK